MVVFFGTTLFSVVLSLAFASLNITLKVASEVISFSSLAKTANYT
jgi:hypothetical protein